MKFPKTPEEWQQAVDAAHACRLIHDARQYGLITGGPGVDTARCDMILAEGMKQGICPRAEVAEQFTSAWNAGKVEQISLPQSSGI